MTQMGMVCVILWCPWQDNINGNNGDDVVVDNGSGAVSTYDSMWPSYDPGGTQAFFSDTSDGTSSQYYNSYEQQDVIPIATTSTTTYFPGEEAGSPPVDVQDPSYQGDYTGEDFSTTTMSMTSNDPWNTGDGGARLAAIRRASVTSSLSSNHTSTTSSCDGREGHDDSDYWPITDGLYDAVVTVSQGSSNSGGQCLLSLPHPLYLYYCQSSFSLFFPEL